MSVWSTWFGKVKEKHAAHPRFGRFSDAYKSQVHYEMWDKAQTHFFQGEYIREILALIEFISNPASDNVILMDSHQVKFAFLQGSKKIEVGVDMDNLRAETHVASVTETRENWMKQLLENNYHLQYCRYSMDDENNIKLSFDSALLDLTPHKFYYALRELALVADKMDDLLLNDFEGLEPTDNQHIIENSGELLEAKYRFFKNKIQAFRERWCDGEELRSSEDHLLSYAMLNLVYEIDYFLMPQGRIMELLERIHNVYFTMELPDISSKNQRAFRVFRQIMALTEERVKGEFYHVIHTFGIVKAVGQETVKALILGEKKNLKWYREHGQPGDLQTIVEYVFGFAIFSYAPPEPMRKLMDLYFRIVEEDFVKACWEVRANYKDGHGDIIQRKVKKDIKLIVKQYSSRFPELYIDLDLLESNHPDAFAWGMIRMIEKANWTEVLP